MQMKPMLSMLQGDDISSNNNRPFNIELEGGGCPVGTVPIRRITKDDLIRQRLTKQMRGGDDSPDGDVSLLQEFLQLFDFQKFKTLLYIFLHKMCHYFHTGYCFRGNQTVWRRLQGLSSFIIHIQAKKH